MFSIQPYSSLKRKGIWRGWDHNLNKKLVWCRAGVLFPLLTSLLGLHSRNQASLNGVSRRGREAPRVPFLWPIEWPLYSRNRVLAWWGPGRGGRRIFYMNLFICGPARWRPRERWWSGKISTRSCLSMGNVDIQLKYWFLTCESTECFLGQHTGSFKS